MITTDSRAGANCVLTILVLRASLIVLTFILSSHLVIVIAVCWKKKRSMISMCLPTIIVVGGRTGQHVGTSFLIMSIGLYLLQISKQMLTMSCHSSSQSLLNNCCHTHPQSLFGYSQLAVLVKKKKGIITWLAIIDVDFDLRISLRPLHTPVPFSKS